MNSFTGHPSNAGCAVSGDFTAVKCRATAWRDGTTAVFLSPANLTARMAALIPLPGRPTIRHWLGRAPLVQLGAFAPNAKLRPLVVQAGAQAPRRRGKPQAGGHDCQVALSDAALLALPVADYCPWAADFPVEVDLPAAF